MRRLSFRRGEGFDMVKTGVEIRAVEREGGGEGATRALLLARPLFHSEP